MAMNNLGGIFTSVKKKRPPRSRFNLSHDVKLSLRMGKLVPMYVQEVLPGDSFKISTASLFRMAPLVSPVMHKINIYQEFFFVPNRILWSNWETFITGSRNGKQLGQDEMPAFPTIRPYYNSSDKLVTNEAPSGLADYMGIPPTVTFGDEAYNQQYADIRVNALPFAAYQRIFDEYYRDENLDESVYDIVESGETPRKFENYNQLPDGYTGASAGPDSMWTNLLTIRNRAWQHDYFTSALPWAQKGEEVRIPVDLDGTISFDPDGETLLKRESGINLGLTGIQMNAQQQSSQKTRFAPDSNPTVFTNVDNSSNLSIDTSGSSGTINDLRAAIKLQEWLETNARGGSRYFESLYAHFGVKSPDSRLQRPEFIGSQRSTMVISEVLQQSSPQSEDDTPQGNMSGHGQSIGSSRNFRYYAQEHGFIIGLVSILPTTAYMQGAERFWFKTGDRLDYYFPEFAHLGEQEIRQDELWIKGTDSSDPETFGYTPRYSEYKFKNSRVAGDFRDVLAYWHLARKFENEPALNKEFVVSNPDNRIFAVQDLPKDTPTEGRTPLRNYDTIYAHIFHDIKASRLMPKYGTPRL